MKGSWTKILVIGFLIFLIWISPGSAGQAAAGFFNLLLNILSQIGAALQSFFDSTATESFS